LKLFVFSKVVFAEKADVRLADDVKSLPVDWASIRVKLLHVLANDHGLVKRVAIDWATVKPNVAGSRFVRFGQVRFHVPTIPYRLGLAREICRAFAKPLIPLAGFAILVSSPIEPTPYQVAPHDADNRERRSYPHVLP
jgi:hypothetical protein